MSSLKRGCMIPIEGEILDKKQFINEYSIRFDMLAVQSIATRTDFPYCASKPIIFFESEWIIHVYPNGLDIETIGQVNVILIGASKTNMKIECALKSSQPLGCFILEPQIVSLSISSPMEAIADTCGETKNLFNKTSMFSSTDGQFEIQLAVKTLDDKYCHSNLFPNAKVLRDRLFHKATCDVDIVVEGTRIPAHKLILSLASPVFTAMFENQMQESVSNEIVISDFSEEVVRSMLRCIYDCDAVKSEVEKHADQLLFIANKYELTEIERVATDHIICTITIDNAITVLQSADKFDRVSIKNAAMQFIVTKAEHFFRTQDFILTVGIDLMNEILENMIANNRIK